MTSDNASSMVTSVTKVASLLAEEANWSAQDNHLRCLGHILNLAVQAFLFSKDEEAINYPAAFAA